MRLVEAEPSTAQPRHAPANRRVHPAAAATPAADDSDKLSGHVGYTLGKHMLWRSAILNERPPGGLRRHTKRSYAFCE